MTSGMLLFSGDDRLKLVAHFQQRYLAPRVANGGCGTMVRQGLSLRLAYIRLRLLCVWRHSLFRSPGRISVPRS